MPEQFGGLWVGELGRPHVAVVGNVGAVETIVNQARLSQQPIFESANVSEVDLDVTMGRLGLVLKAADSASEGFYVGDVLATMIRLSIPRNAIVIDVADGSDEQFIMLRAEFGPSLVFEPSPGAPMEICSGRSSCGSPLRAGVTLFKNSYYSACQSSFVMKNDHLPPNCWITSAGHCYDSNWKNRYHPAYSYFGTSSGQYHLTSTPVDGMVITLPSSQASNLLYVTSTFMRSVTSVESMSSAVIGESVCSSRLSGVSCGYLVSKNVCASASLCGLWDANGQYACSGDSGSPAYYPPGSTTARAIGIVGYSTPGTTSCPSDPKAPKVGSESLYTHIANVVGAFHLSVNLAP